MARSQFLCSRPFRVGQSALPVMVPMNKSTAGIPSAIASQETGRGVVVGALGMRDPNYDNDESEVPSCPMIRSMLQLAVPIQQTTRR